MCLRTRSKTTHMWNTEKRKSVNILSHPWWPQRQLSCRSYLVMEWLINGLLLWSRPVPYHFIHLTHSPSPPPPTHTHTPHQNLVELLHRDTHSLLYFRLLKNKKLFIHVDDMALNKNYEGKSHSREGIFRLQYWYFITMHTDLWKGKLIVAFTRK